MTGLHQPNPVFQSVPWPGCDPVHESTINSVIDSPESDALRLQTWLHSLQRVVVAFSGGVDSSVVAAAAHRAGLERSIAVTADSPSVARWQLELAKQIAAQIGIEHQIVQTGEGDREDYRRNDKRRCFFCKQTLYASLSELTQRYADMTIVSGTNLDDLGDYRPGIEAGRQSSVATPLAELGLNKSRVRSLARHFGLSNADLPASPCLASRIAYGTEVTPERLRRIEQAEDWLRHNGFTQLRVRLHAGELARIEVPKSEIPRLIELDHDGGMTRDFQSYGFADVTVDLQGFRSGNMNRVLVALDEQPLSPTKPAVDNRPSIRSQEVVH